MILLQGRQYHRGADVIAVPRLKRSLPSRLFRRLPSISKVHASLQFMRSPSAVHLPISQSTNSFTTYSSDSSFPAPTLSDFPPVPTSIPKSNGTYSRMNGRNRLIKPRRHFVEPLPDIPPLPAHRFRFYVPNPGVHRQPFQGDFVPLPQEAQKVIQDFKASLGPISDTWFTKDRTTEVIDWNGTLIFALQNAARTVCSRFQKFGYVGVLGWCDEFSDLVKSIEDIAYRGQLLLSTRELVLVTCEDILQLDEVKTVNIIALQLSSQIHRLYQVLGNEPQE